MGVLSLPAKEVFDRTNPMAKLSLAIKHRIHRRQMALYQGGQLSNLVSTLSTRGSLVMGLSGLGLGFTLRWFVGLRWLFHCLLMGLVPLASQFTPLAELFNDDPELLS